MENIERTEILYFEKLKLAIQEKYIQNHTPSHDDISKWKGIDIVYFQEDLRKYAKGNISEKTFYTYFKSKPVTKLPRIDMLNLLSLYAGYQSWFNYKKENTINKEVIENNIPDITNEDSLIVIPVTENKTENNPSENTIEKNLELTNPAVEIAIEKNTETADLQINIPEKQNVNTIKLKQNKTEFIKKYLWTAVSSLLFITVLFLVFRDQWLTNEFQYSFIDADRNTKINAELDVKIIKEKESPILFRVKPNESFIYTTKNKSLTMIVSSPFYKTDTITRNLENAPEAENIELKPNDYAIQLYYYSKSIKDLKKKREQLNSLISDNALIYQVFDNDTYGVETLNKQKYLTLVTLPTTALENLNVIETQMKNGKIIMIKFKIDRNEK